MESAFGKREGGRENNTSSQAGNAEIGAGEGGMGFAK